MCNRVIFRVSSCYSCVRFNFLQFFHSFNQILVFAFNLSKRRTSFHQVLLAPAAHQTLFQELDILLDTVFRTFIVLPLHTMQTSEGLQKYAPLNTGIFYRRQGQIKDKLKKRIVDTLFIAQLTFLLLSPIPAERLKEKITFVYAI